MANTAQARKRARQNDKARAQNASQRSTMRTYLKRVIKAIAEGKSEQALAEYRLMSSMVDKMVTKGIIHKNKAARHKSRFIKHIEALAA